MTFPVSIVLSGVSAVIRYRQRVDQILSLNEATTGLPFRLPPLPLDFSQHTKDMLRFFQGERGKAVLALHNLDADFELVLKAHSDALQWPQPAVQNCFRLYVTACEIKPENLMKQGTDPTALASAAAKGPSEDMRLAYYVVESDRLSRNPALARIVLATADTLLEIVGQNASTFISNPKTRVLVEGLLKEFAVENDFDDDSAATLFRNLLGATAFAALDNPGILPNKPALNALYAALNDVRKSLQAADPNRGPERFARLITRDGFERIVNAYMTQIAKDPSFVTSSETARKAITAVLGEVEGRFTDLFKQDDEARYRVLEALIATGADHVGPLLSKELDGRPLAAAIFSAVANEIGKRAKDNQLVKSFAKGEFIGDLYAVALTAVAENGQALAKEADVSAFVGDLVAKLAGDLAARSPAAALSRESFNRLLTVGLTELSQHPRVLTSGNRFSAGVLASAVAAAAQLSADGLNKEDVDEIFAVVLRQAAGNASRAALDKLAGSTLDSTVAAIVAANLATVTTPQGRKQLLLTVFDIVMADPRLWEGVQQRELLQPLLQGLVVSVAKGRTEQFFSEEILVQSTALVLDVLNQRGRVLFEGAGRVTQIVAVVDRAMIYLDLALGMRLRAQQVPEFLEATAIAYLKAPFDIAQMSSPDVETFFDQIILQGETL